MKRKGIMICGLNGAGKSTLGKEIACRWNAEWIDNEQLYFSNEGEYGTFCSSQTAWHRLYARLDDRAQANTPFIYCCVNNEDDDLLSYLDGVVYLSIGKEDSQARIRERSKRQFGTRLAEDKALQEREEAFFESVRRKDTGKIERWVENLERQGVPVLRLDAMASIEANANQIERWIATIKKNRVETQDIVC